jgi:hypothetical protein
MRTAFASAAGAVSGETTFMFEQTGDVFSARYRGGAIVDGYLIGRLGHNGQVVFRYVQADAKGNLDAGESTGLISRLPDGRLRLTENFQWATRPEKGQNVFEEVV